MTNQNDRQGTELVCFREVCYNDEVERSNENA